MICTEKVKNHKEFLESLSHIIIPGDDENVDKDMSDAVSHFWKSTDPAALNYLLENIAPKKNYSNDTDSLDRGALCVNTGKRTEIILNTDILNEEVIDVPDFNGMNVQQHQKHSQDKQSQHVPLYSTAVFREPQRSPFGRGKPTAHQMLFLMDSEPSNISGITHRKSSFHRTTKRVDDSTVSTMVLRHRLTSHNMGTSLDLRGRKNEHCSQDEMQKDNGRCGEGERDLGEGNPPTREGKGIKRDKPPTKGGKNIKQGEPPTGGGKGINSEQSIEQPLVPAGSFTRLPRHIQRIFDPKRADKLNQKNNAACVNYRKKRTDKMKVNKQTIKDLMEELANMKKAHGAGMQ